jgi:peptidylprolyl isomerase
VPPSKQARSRQARQKERLAIAATRRQRVQRRRRNAGAVIAAVIIVVLLVLVLLLPVLDNGSSNKTTTSTTVAATESAKGKPCVAVKDPLPKGAPAVPVDVGPPPAKLLKKDLKAGTGAVVQPGATITANYVGVACSTGKIFDSSWSRGKPAEFPLSGVIEGWTEGIPGMRVGGQRLLGIPSEQAYKSSGQGDAILPDEALWFVVDVVSVK